MGAIQVHCDDATAPIAAVVLCVGHRVHATLPSSGLKEPTAQASNTPLLLKKPTAATHSETS
jgi:hypothetical protein